MRRLLLAGAAFLAIGSASAQSLKAPGAGGGYAGRPTPAAIGAALGGYQTLPYASTITPNVATQAIASATLTGNFTLSCPTGMVAGGSYQIRFVQDSTGNRVATWPTCFKWPGGTAGALSTAANAVDVLTFTSFDGTTADAVLSKTFQ